MSRGWLSCAAGCGGRHASWRGARERCALRRRHDRDGHRARRVHRRHAVIETVFADLIDGPLAHMPSGRFGTNSAWVLCAAIAHNLLYAAGTLAGDSHRVARGATLRRQIITVPARLARPARTPMLHLPR